jgi:hypothetical protein
MEVSLMAELVKSVNKFAPVSKIQLRVSEDIKLETLQDIVTRITHLAGCPTCGLLGIDLQILGDPVELRQIGELPGVRSIAEAA